MCQSRGIAGRSLRQQVIVVIQKNESEDAPLPLEGIEIETFEQNGFPLVGSHEGTFLERSGGDLQIAMGNERLVGGQWFARGES
jgi:hypothetical protein